MRLPWGLSGKKLLAFLFLVPSFHAVCRICAWCSEHRGEKAGAETVRLGGQYFKGYVWDCVFAGIHFCFSGYFCDCGKSGLSFLHNILAIMLVRVPGVYLTSQFFPSTMFPMGLATAIGSLFSVCICVAAFAVLQRKRTERG